SEREGGRDQETMWLTASNPIGRRLVEGSLPCFILDAITARLPARAHDPQLLAAPPPGSRRPAAPPGSHRAETAAPLAPVPGGGSRNLGSTPKRRHRSTIPTAHRTAAPRPFGPALRSLRPGPAATAGAGAAAPRRTAAPCCPSPRAGGSRAVSLLDHRAAMIA